MTSASIPIPTSSRSTPCASAESIFDMAALRNYWDGEQTG